ncbi:hypothetical protein B0H10DRAFT_1961287 [Mycena sp. CBHHK59/15]|nr:hypothetical protein B0H10DRAFT_1961287 [Mycena sp. CBHHK59/15]
MYDFHPGAISDVMVPFAYPCRFGYHLPWRNLHTAVITVLRLHDTFLPSMATMTMMILVLGKFGNSWRDAVIAKSGVHPQWFADLEASAVGDLNIERVRRIINLFLHDDPVLMRRSKSEFLLDLVVGSLPVLLYFYWGTIDGMLYFPVPKILEEMKLRDSHPYRADPHTAMVNPHDTDSSNQTGTFPPVEKHSGQKDGEDVHAFFAQRKNLNEKRAEMENPSMKTRHLVREVNAAQGMPPGAVNHEAAADMWSDYTPNHRMYDSFEDQWDLCTALTLAEEPENDDDDEPDEALDNDLEDQFPEFPNVPTGLLLDEQLGEHSTADDLECSHDLSKDDSSADTPYEPYHDMSEIPYCRFGFTEPSSSIQYAENPHADHCCKALGDEHWPLLQQTLKQNVPALLAFISAAKSIHDVPKELLDLWQEGAEAMQAPPREIPPPYIAAECCHHASPHGHAARIAGGIISRLARRVVNDDITCLGPTADVFDNGVCFWDGQSSTAYWDDDLTRQEIDLICGVYQVATGQHDAGTEDGMQKTNVYWWPKPVAWHASTLAGGHPIVNVGF